MIISAIIPAITFALRMALEQETRAMVGSVTGSFVVY